MKFLIDGVNEIKTNLNTNYLTLETLNEAQTQDIANIKIDIAQALERLEELHNSLNVNFNEMMVKINEKSVIIENKLDLILSKVDTNEE
jgi:hypothetical protein